MFNRTDILRTAWSDYRRDVKWGLGVMRDGPFSRRHFAYCLRMAWAVAKCRVAKATEPEFLPPPKPVLSAAAQARADEINAELDWMQYGERIDWARHNDLRAELARLAA